MAQRRHPQGSVYPTTSSDYAAPPALTQQQIERRGWLTTAEAYRGLNLSTQPNGSSPATSSASADTVGHSSSTGTPVYSSSSSSSAFMSSGRSQAYPSSASSSAYSSSGSSAYSSSTSYPAHSSSARGHSPSHTTAAHPSARPSNNSPLGPSSASSTLLSPLRPSTDQRVRSESHSATSSDGVEYTYIGVRALSGRNVLQRVESMSANSNIKSFDAYHITCAGCDVAIWTRGSALYNDTKIEGHQNVCSVLREWKDPFSAHKLTAAMRMELKRSRKASRDQALAHLESEGYLRVVRVIS